MTKPKPKPSKTPPKPQPDRLQRLKMDLPPEDALRGAMQVPPPPPAPKAQKPRKKG